MTSKERMMAVFNRQKPDRYPCFEHFWAETIGVWFDQGFPRDVDLYDYFDFDISNCGGFDISAQYAEELISEDADYKIIRDSRGIIARHHKHESGHTPQWLEKPIKDPADWWKYKEKLVFNDRRIDSGNFDRSAVQREKDRFICMFGADPYEFIWPVFGQEDTFMCMLDDPRIIADAMETYTDLTISCLDHYTKNGLDYDGYFMYGDFGYRNGTLFSRELFRTLIFPSHKRICDYLHDNGKKSILHSCGKIKTLIPDFIEAGFDAIQPLEAKCGQDVRELAPEHNSKIVFFGNIDVRVLGSDKDSIRDEILSKLAIFDGQWNYIFHSDHSVPQTVSFDNYKYALELVHNFLSQNGGK